MTISIQLDEIFGLLLFSIRHVISYHYGFYSDFPWSMESVLIYGNYRYSVTSVLKSRDASQVSSYRPIKFLSHIVKLFESIVFKIQPCVFRETT